ncbi:MAG TPA: hypothetical protein VFM18_23490 [Methanosarcina sp.]|nr:hypothetical protein [Methanosarcina sp.]
MTKIIEILNKIEATSSRNEKEDIIAQHKDNPLFQLVLKASMDPQITFYLAKLPKVSLVENNCLEPVTLEEAINDAINLLAGRKVTGNAARAWYDNTSASLSVEDRIVFERVIKKDLRCGTKEATVNNAFGYEFIYEHPNLLCSPFSEKDVTKLFKKNPTVYCQMKSDGSRCQIVILEDQVIAYTRKGNILDFGNRLDHLLSIPELKGMVIDGELLTRRNGVVDDRSTCNGIINKLIQGTIPQEELDLVFMTAWDIFPWENMKTKTPFKVPYKDRLSNLENIINQENVLFVLESFLELIETHEVSSLEEAETIYNKWMESGKEGAILKSPDMIWEDKRSKNAIKVKAEETAEFVVVGWEYGEDDKQFSYALGGLIVETSCGKLRTKIGKGFKEEERLNFLGYETPQGLDDAIRSGLIVECNYNSITRSKNKDTASLFLEKFIKIRFDKTTANSLEEIE